MAVEYPPVQYSQAELTPRLAATAAIVGEAACSGLVDYAVELATSKGPRGHFLEQDENKIIMHTLPGESHAPESFLVDSGFGGAMTSCRTTSTRSRPGSRERTETLLVANPDRPGGLLKVTLSSGDDDVRTPVASEDATLDTMLEMARSIGDSARQLEQPPEWRLHGNNRGLGKLMVNANRLVPVVSQLVRTVGRFAAKPALAGRAATTRLGVNVGSSGRVYGGMLRGGRQEILVSTTDTHSRMSGDFSLTFKYGGGSGDEEFAFANCTLRLEDRTGTWPWSATQDTLEQRGTELWRIRRQQIGTAAPTTIGEYPATDATILDMAHAAITAQDIPIR